MYPLALRKLAYIFYIHPREANLELHCVYEYSFHSVCMLQFAQCSRTGCRIRTCEELTRRLQRPPFGHFGNPAKALSIPEGTIGNNNPYGCLYGTYILGEVAGIDSLREAPLARSALGCFITPSISYLRMAGMSTLYPHDASIA